MNGTYSHAWLENLNLTAYFFTRGDDFILVPQLLKSYFVTHPPPLLALSGSLRQYPGPGVAVSCRSVGGAQFPRHQSSHGRQAVSRRRDAQ